MRSLKKNSRGNRPDLYTNVFNYLVRMWCRDHGKAIDPTDSEFTVERLREWKKPAENESMNGRMDLNNASASTMSTSIRSVAHPS